MANFMMFETQTKSRRCALWTILFALLYAQSLEAREETVERLLTFDQNAQGEQASFGAAEVDGFLGVEWDGQIERDTLVGPAGFEDGFRIGTPSRGLVGFEVVLDRSSVNASAEVPVRVHFELPEDGVVAPEEQFTISTNWSTPLLRPEPELTEVASFEVTDPTTWSVSTGLVSFLDYLFEIRACALGSCDSGSIRMPPFLGPSGFIDFTQPIFQATRTDGELSLTSPAFGEQTPVELAQSLGLDPTGDPLPVDALSLIDGRLSGVSSFDLVTGTSGVNQVNGEATAGVPKYTSLSNGWRRDVFALNADLTNMITAYAGFATGRPVPPFNGTLGDIVNIVLAQFDGLTPTEKVAGFFFGQLFTAVEYNFIEFEMEASVDAINTFKLTPRAPEVRIMNGTEALSGWFKAGEDVVITMPLFPQNVTAEVRAAPTMTSELKIVSDPEARFSALEFRVAPYSTLSLVGDVTGDLIKDGDRVLASTDQILEFSSQTFIEDLNLPTVLAEPRVELSGANGFDIGGQPGNCPEFDNLPPGTPSGVSYDERDGCVVSFRDLSIQGGSITSFSEADYSLTLLNSVLRGQGGQLAPIVLDPNGNTSVKLTGSVRQSGFSDVDLFFDDDTSSGNRNQIVVDTVHGAAIRNSLLRGRISNENQSDIVVRSGRLWIDGTQMELDNFTVESGVITQQDSTAVLRNLQIGGSPSTSGLRLTRDSLVTTSSNASFNSSTLEVESGSLVNVSGNFQNTGTVEVGKGGWLTVLRGDDPLFADTLVGTASIDGIVNVRGSGSRADSDAALALLPAVIPGPTALFQDQVQGTRLETGSLLLAGGEIRGHELNLIGGTLLGLEGEVSDSSLAFFDGGSLLLAQGTTRFSQSALSGTGTIDILASGHLSLDQVTLGDLVNPVVSLSVVNQGLLDLAPASAAELLGNATLFNSGTVEVAAGTTLTAGDYRQLDGVTNIDGLLVVGGNGLLGIGGDVTGNGMVMGSAINKGSSFVAEGLQVTGSYEQRNGGVLLLDFARTASPFVVVQGAAQFGGTLHVDLTSSVYDSLQLGGTYDFIDYAASTGEFESLVLTVDGSEADLVYSFEVLYGPTRASLRWIDAEEVVVELPPVDLGDDLDSDGMPDTFEAAYGFDPTRPDENNNGILDGQEDADGDGITNAEEAANGTDPRLPDNGVPVPSMHPTLLYLLLPTLLVGAAAAGRRKLELRSRQHRE